MPTATKPRRVLLRDWEARAFAEGRKTLIVRPMKPQPPAWIETMGFTPFTPPGFISGRGLWQGEPSEKFFRCPFGSPGDEVVGCEACWIPPERITIRMRRDGADTWPNVIFDDGPNGSDRLWCQTHGWSFRSSPAMPAWAARWRWRNAGVGVKRLGDVTEEETIANGAFDIEASSGQSVYHHWFMDREGPGGGQGNPSAAFRARWDKDFDKQYPAESNPCVRLLRLEPWPK